MQALENVNHARKLREQMILGNAHNKDVRNASILNVSFNTNNR